MKPAGEAVTRQDLRIGHFVVPQYTPGTSNVWHVEGAESSHLSGIRGQSLAALQQCPDDTGTVYCHLSLHCQLGVCSHYPDK